MTLHTTWHLVRILAIVAAALGVALSPAWEEGAPVTDDNPPYSPPPVEQLFPQDATVTELMGTEMVRVMDAPPDGRVFTLDTAVARDYRRTTIDEAWERRWRSYDGTQDVRVVAEVHTVSSTPPTVAVCEPETEFDLPGASSAGVVFTNELATHVCAALDEGRQHFEVSIVTVVGDHRSRAHRAVAAITADLAEQVNPIPDLEWDGSNMLSGKRMRRVEMVSLLTLIAIATVPGLLISIRRRLDQLSGRTQGRLNPEHVDIEPERRLQALQHSALGFIRVALLIWAMQLTFTLEPLAGIGGSVATMLVAYLGGILLQRRLAIPPRNRQRARLIRGVAAVPSLLGAAGTCVLLVAALGLWYLGTGATGFGSGTGDVATWEMSGFGLTAQILAVVLLGWSLLPIGVGRRVSMALMRDKPQGAVAPILLLRTFADDTLRIWIQRRDRVGFVDSLVMKRRERFEEILTHTLARYGPPTAVGQPGQRLPPGLGGQRFTFSNETWQAGVRRLADDAALICLTIGKTQGLSWEMNHVASSGLLHKTMFVIPPLSQSEQRDRLNLLAASFGLNPMVFDTQVGARRVLAVCWPLLWTRPLVFVSSTADDISYDIVLERCAEALLHQAPPPLGQADAPPVVPQYRDIGLQPAGGGSQRSRWWGPKLYLGTLAVSSIIVPLLGPLLTGDPLGSKDVMTRYISLDSSFNSVSVLGGTEEASYAVLDQQILIRGDFTTGRVELVTEFDAAAVVTTLSDDAVVYVTGGLGSEPLQVGVVDTASGEQMWSAELGQQALSIAVTTDSVVVPQADSQRLLIWDRDTGRANEPVDLPCRPWDVAAYGATMWVTCPGEGKLLSIDDGSISEHPVPVGATTVLAPAGVPFVHIPRDSVLLQPGNEEFRLWTRQPMPLVAASDGALVVEGVDRVTVLSQAGLSRRNTMVPLSSLAVASDGSVQYARYTEWRLLLPTE